MRHWGRLSWPHLGIVQKVFSEKASAIARMRQKRVSNASNMRQKCVKMGLVLLGKEERPKCVRNPSKLRQKCVKNPRNTFRGEHLLDDTEHHAMHWSAQFFSKLPVPEESVEVIFKK